MSWILSDERREVLPTLHGEQSRPNSTRRLIRRYDQVPEATVE